MLGIFGICSDRQWFPIYEKTVFFEKARFLAHNRIDRKR